VLKPCSFAFRQLHPLALKKLSRENRDALHIFENAKVEVTWQLVSSNVSSYSFFFHYFLLWWYCRGEVLVIVIEVQLGLPAG